MKEIRNICERGDESMQFLTLRFAQNTEHGHKYENKSSKIIRRK